jgi:hypothetical protein
MSALPPKATDCCAAAKRRFVPIATFRVAASVGRHLGQPFAWKRAGLLLQCCCAGEACALTADDTVVAISEDVTAAHNGKCTGNVLVEQRSRQQQSRTRAICLNTGCAIFSDYAVLDVDDGLIGTAGDRVEAIAAVAADLAVGEVERDWTVGRVDLYAATRILINRDMIQGRIDASAGGRLEKYAGIVVFEDAVLYDEFGWSNRLRRYCYHSSDDMDIVQDECSVDERDGGQAWKTEYCNVSERDGDACSIDSEREDAGAGPGAIDDDGL